MTSPVVVAVRVVAVDGLNKDGFRDAQAVIAHALGELAGWQDLAAGDAGHVGDQALDFVDPVLFQEFFDGFHANSLILLY